MANTGNRQALLGGSGREQGTRSTEKDFLQLAAGQLVQQGSAKGDGAAAAAGAAAVYVLGEQIKYERAAIRQLSSQWHTFPQGQLQ